MSCWNVGACGAITVPAFVFCSVVLVWVGLLVLPILVYMYLVLASLFLRDGFLL